MNKIIILSALLAITFTTKARDTSYDSIPPLPAPPSFYTADLDLDGRPDTIFYDNEKKELIFHLSRNNYLSEVYAGFDLQEDALYESRSLEVDDGGFSIHMVLLQTRLLVDYFYEKKTGKFRLAYMYYKHAGSGSMVFDEDNFQGNWSIRDEDRNNIPLPKAEIKVDKPFYWGEQPDMLTLGLALFDEYLMLYEPENKEIVRYAGTFMDESDNYEYLMYYEGNEGYDETEVYGIIACNYEALEVGEYIEVTTGIYFYTEPGDRSFHAGYNIVGIRGLGKDYIPSGIQEDEVCEIGFIEYEGQHYKAQPTLIFKNRNGSLTIRLACNDRYKEKLLYEIYLTLKVTDYTLPEMGFYPVSATQEDNEPDLTFYRHYIGWNGANHKLKAESGNFFLRKISETVFLISGEFKLDSRGRETVKFLHYGELTPDVVEVAGIMMMKMDDIENNKGILSIDGKEIETNFGFHRYDSGMYRYYIADRLLMRDRALEYGVFFDFPEWIMPEGKFTQSDTSRLSGVGFFELDRTIIPDEYEVKVEYNSRKNEYEVGYKFFLPDGRQVEGKYSGRMAKMQLE